MKSYNPTLNNGFTLVEISIVMIIVGLLIGGVFGGMKLIDNANIQKTVQDLKAIESAALTFRDTYRALPGDIRTPNTRISNCTVAPCATAGNGDRVLGIATWSGAIINTDENFTFWHHLQAANLLQMDFRNTTDMNFGEGQPSAPIIDGYRVVNITTNLWGCANVADFRASLTLTNTSNAALNVAPATSALSCRVLSILDRKADNEDPHTGKIIASNCAASCASLVYNESAADTFMFYNLGGF